MTIDRKKGAVAAMPRENLDSLSKAALEQFGLEMQMNKVQEECGELITALSKWRTTEETEKSLQQVITELADVIITVRQATLAFGEDLVQMEVQKKLAYLKGLIRESRVSAGQGSSKIIGQTGFDKGH